MEFQDFMRVAVTVLGFVCFVVLTIWAWSKRRQDSFDAAANALIEDDDTPHPTRHTS
ncbi:Cbb3-type cytochrome oxidase component FixQ [Andreprevotia lacus DSM 23236]|jgi:cytochrome c oxidase cbb3-type subunit 4|uniref:Cbb3-type cytochrome oxidase component FixQ n=1 Tax=Andreprevotia lacus DSM 23236 TaxID=1121001 RepID=A0A1W1XDY4_9NEIS|nr:cbb3-type cytochrome c oxidase subunit 3 [Andreprevotia lacus]SMC22103.1 Cbb3-type cytochrome oxidase component FixQ [Andreprevotia lacus DSM 23236]